MAIIAANSFKKVSEQNETVKLIGQPAFVLINFCIGFITTPIVVPVTIQNHYLKWRIKKLTEKNNKLKKP